MMCQLERHHISSIGGEIYKKALQKQSSFEKKLGKGMGVPARNSHD